MADLARLEELIEPEARALGFELVRVKIMASEAGDGAQALQIMAEDPATGQLVIDQCAALSRRVSEKLDALEEAGTVLVPGAYHLEVSSPGIDRPLTRKKDFADWAGHEVKVAFTEKVHGRRNLTGRLMGISDDDMITVIDKRGADKNEAGVSFPRSLIHSAKLVLTDELIAATQPLDTAGADDILEETEEKADD